MRGAWLVERVLVGRGGMRGPLSVSRAEISWHHRAPYPCDHVDRPGKVFDNPRVLKKLRKCHPFCGIFLKTGVAKRVRGGRMSSEVCMLHT